MPANARQIEAHYTVEPDDAPEQACPECEGRGEVFDVIDLVLCPLCGGDRTIRYEPDPDREYDAAVDREMEERLGRGAQEEGNV